MGEAWFQRGAHESTVVAQHKRPVVASWRLFTTAGAPCCGVGARVSTLILHAARSSQVANAQL